MFELLSRFFGLFGGGFFENSEEPPPEPGDGDGEIRVKNPVGG